MKQYKIKSVVANNRSRAFTVRVVGRPDAQLVVPYSYAKVDGLVESVERDAETGNAGFLWTTRDGVEGAMLAEEVLFINRDTEVIMDQLLYKLTMRADALRRERNVSIGVLASMAGIAPQRASQLLSPEYRKKSVSAVMKLLIVLGDEKIEGRLMELFAA